MSIVEMVEDFNGGRIGHREVLNRIDGYEDSLEKLNFMLVQAMVTPEDFTKRKFILKHPEILTERDNRSTVF